jgi:DNA-binding response OmpR family regulator
MFPKGTIVASIFLVEDETLIRMMVADMVVELGHTIAAEAADLKHGLVLAQKATFDFAILDMQLLDGSSEPIAEVLERRKIPFALATGYRAANLTKRYDGSAVLEKPFELMKPQRCIEAMVSSRS